jgi:hypothetical protein
MNPLHASPPLVDCPPLPHAPASSSPLAVRHPQVAAPSCGQGRRLPPCPRPLKSASFFDGSTAKRRVWGRRPVTKGRETPLQGRAPLWVPALMSGRRPGGHRAFFPLSPLAARLVSRARGLVQPPPVVGPEGFASLGLWVAPTVQDGSVLVPASSRSRALTRATHLLCVQAQAHPPRPWSGSCPPASPPSPSPASPALTAPAPAPALPATTASPPGRCPLPPRPTSLRPAPTTASRTGAVQSR